MAAKGGLSTATKNEIMVPMEESVEDDCTICSYKYTGVIRRRIPCKYCKKGTCSKCIEAYLLTRPEDAHCVHCRVHYNDKDLHEICTKTYLKDRYFKHRQEILISRERANLPALQTVAQAQKKRIDRLAEQSALSKEIKDLTEARNKIRAQFVECKLANKSDRDPECKQLSVDMDSYLETINRKKQQLYELRYVREDEEVVEEKKEDTKKFIRRCMKADCNGFLSTAWKCGLCEWYSCSKCFTVRGKEHDALHECKKEDIETADLIKSDSKPCPNCGEFINKSSGCFAPNTPILMWDNRVKMSQDIQVGDELVGDDGEKRTVLSLVSGEDMMYLVQQNNIALQNYTVNSKHTLVLKIDDKCKNKQIVEQLQELPTVQPPEFPAIVHILVEDYIRLPDSVKDNLVGYGTKGITDIDVQPVGQGQYFGWAVDSNKRFLLADTTVLHNCSQMYCVSCQTPFDWNTLKIVTSGAIHNPHYYEMMKRKGALPRNPGDVPCGGFPNRWQLVDHPINTNIIYSNYFLEFHRLCIEAQDMAQRAYRAHIDNTTTHDINIRFLLNEFDEARWGRMLAMNEKKKKRDAEVQEVFAAFLMVAVNLINTVQNYHDETYERFTYLPTDLAEDILLGIHEEITELIAIMNEAFKGISIAYSYSVPMIETQRFETEKKLLIYRLVVKSFTSTKKAKITKPKGAASAFSAAELEDSDSDFD